MITPVITSLYAGLLALLLVALSARVIQARFRAHVSLGDGDDRHLVRAMRAQANFAEYAPMGLIVLALAELQGVPVWALHLLGASLLVGRLTHAIGFGRSPQITSMRRIGIVLTFAVLTAGAIVDILWALS